MLAAPRRALLALVLVVLTLVSGGCGSKSGPGPSAASPGNLSATPPAGALQEVAPPGAVQQLNERLNERAPQVRVLAPQDNALLPAGPWSLKLQVSDWPLSDAGALGLGPHLMVQLDDQEPLRITSSKAAASVPMPDLRPGSHRITVYAARPWGEAVKAPGASAQIRVHRVARNAAELPASGSAQLIAASPDAQQAMEPVLIDWLLLDAPLQNLRGDDARWRLRISVNGDSFLVDRQTPLWLKGFKRGSNAVQLELLDGRGDPLNPPFNSVVREVVIGSAGPQPAWLRPRLSATDLALLSGEQPAVEAAAEATEVPAPKPPHATADPPATQNPNAELSESSGKPDKQTSSEPVAEPEATAEALPEPSAAPSPESEPSPEPAPPAGATEPPADDNSSLANDPARSDPTPEALTLPAEPVAPATDPAPDPDPATDPASTPEASEAPAAAVAPPPPPPERLAPQTSLTGSARDQVNANGELLKPSPRGPLAGLREKLGG
ncbi:MAG: hypothetical protein FJ049_05285 [Cyanobacteria bacterium M_surface_7_m2_037]|nr:hypothetical protein [Cyanobacteria bacterium K_DeepCast_0m_m1_088]MBM5795524.1 hypothetical protein [Cyanobacteria bacterium M_surface_7_m2_037]MBM5819736.1 hypothetical protein [Cyanobacteria bacterium K_DeepCast_150m_m2_101]